MTEVLEEEAVIAVDLARRFTLGEREVIYVRYIRFLLTVVENRLWLAYFWAVTGKCRDFFGDTDFIKS